MFKKGCKNTFFTELHQLTTDECLDVLRGIGLDHHCNTFLTNKVDGSLLEALMHPTLGHQMLTSLGVTDGPERHRLITELYRVKGQGYNSQKATSSSN